MTETDVEKPNFLIIGAPKCGTTSLYNWLTRDENIFMPQNKEPSFFLNHYGYSDWKQYLSLFANNKNARLRGEASAGYLAAPESPSLIHKFIPDIKMIVMLRDPVARAYSAWSWMAMEGYEPLTNFGDAIDAESRRYNDPEFVNTVPQYFMDYFYFRVGLYADQLERYFDVFDRDQILILLFDDLVKDPVSTYTKACSFLGVKPMEVENLKAANPSNLPASIKFQYCLRSIKTSKFALFTEETNDRIQKLAGYFMDQNTKLGRRYKIDPEVDIKLRQLYIEPNAKLEKMISRDLSMWNRGLRSI